MDSDGRNKGKLAVIIDNNKPFIPSSDSSEEDYDDFTELYSIHVSGDKIKLRPNITGMNEFPSDSIYTPDRQKRLKQEQNSEKSITLCGPKSQLEMDSDGRNQAKPAGIFDNNKPFLPPSDSSEEDVDDVLDFTDHGAFELYSIHVSGDGSGLYDVREIKVRPNFTGMNEFPSDSIYTPAQAPDRQKRLKQEQISEKSITLCGPKYHLAAAYAHIIILLTNSGYKSGRTFLPDWDEFGGMDKVRTNIISRAGSKANFTLSYEWITSQARANFCFSFLAEQVVSIENLRGFIQVSSLKEGTTRTLGLFHDDCVLSGDALPLLRSSAAFPAGEDFTLHFNLSYLLDGSPKEIRTSKTLRSPSVGKGVYTQKGLDKAKKDPELFKEHVIGDQYPKLQMTVFWLTILFPQSAF